ncbi:DUF4252 domain-containing protein [Flavobacterium sp.]|uniref:DUF4252 domain-containing protein n=1 Tax=Flavobacterium sp. TaxID=239 RepID=UPI002A809647|nr:DUF4252 domain-containing protein [Flavobacterium sp.]
MMKVFVITILSFLALSCSNKPTLQKYFVENTEDKDFIAIDVSPSVLNLEKASLSESEEKALETFDKMNIIAFKKDSLNDKKFKDEVIKVKSILKDEEYQQLMKFGSSKQGAAIYFVGEDDNIDEFVVYANNATSGFALVRILGDNMNPNDVMILFELMRKSKIDIDQLKPLEGILK